MNIEVAKTAMIMASTAAAPTLFVVKDQINIVPAQKRLAFLAKHLNNKCSIFENYLFATAEMLDPQYSGGYWEFASIKINDKKELFFCYPDSVIISASNPMNYAEGVMDNMTFGLICTIIALGNAFYEVGEFRRNELYWHLEELKSWVFNDLYEQMEKLTDAQKIYDYRRLIREVAKFID